MPGYRLYFLDENGRVMAAAEAECTTDADARIWASMNLDDRSAELWAGARVLAKFEPRQAAYRNFDRVRTSARVQPRRAKQALDPASHLDGLSEVVRHLEEVDRLLSALRLDLISPHLRDGLFEATKAGGS